MKRLVSCIALLLFLSLLASCNDDGSTADGDISVVGTSETVVTDTMDTETTPLPERHDIQYFSIGEDEFTSIKNARTPSDSMMIDSISFGGNELFRDADGQYYYSITDGDAYGFSPEVSFEGKKNTNIAFVSPMLTEESVSENIPLKFIVYNDKKYSVGTVSVTTLPIMNITYSSKRDIERDLDTKMQLWLYDNRKNAGIRVTESYGTIHVRGATTSSFPKVGYKLELFNGKSPKSGDERKESLLGMRRDDDWILYAAYNDGEKVRNVFSSNLWFESCAKDNSFGAVAGMEYRYIELFFNGCYHGLYALGFPIDEKQMNLSKDDETDTYSDHLFKKVSWDASEFDKALLSQPTLSAYVLKSNASDEVAAWDDLRSIYTVHGTGDAESIKSVTDIDSAIDIYLFFQLVAGVDNVSGDCLKNLYVAVYHTDDGGKKLVYAPWDLDYTFGNMWAYELKNYTRQYGIISKNMNVTMNLNPAVLAAAGDDMIKTKIAEKYRMLREGAWSDAAIGDMISSFEDDIFGSGAFLRDRERWPDGSYTSMGGLGKFRKFVKERIGYMDDFIEREFGE